MRVVQPSCICAYVTRLPRRNSKVRFAENFKTEKNYPFRVNPTPESRHQSAEDESPEASGRAVTVRGRSVTKRRRVPMPLYLPCWMLSSGAESIFFSWKNCYLLVVARVLCKRRLSVPRDAQSCYFFAASSSKSTGYSW